MNASSEVVYFEEVGFTLFPLPYSFAYEEK